MAAWQWLSQDRFITVMALDPTASSSATRNSTSAATEKGETHSFLPHFPNAAAATASGLRYYYYYYHPEKDIEMVVLLQNLLFSPFFE